MMTAEQLTASILQLAMEGKLVEQRSEEGTGEKLYQKIQAEKAKLVKEGKLKKQKALPEITDADKPFEIPDSWSWVRLGEISSYAQPKEKVSVNQITSDMWSLDLEDVERNTGKILKKVKASERIIKGDKVRFKKGDILYSKLRPYLLKILIAPDDGITSPEFVPFRVYGDIRQNFFLWYLRSPWVDSAVNSASYGVKMPRVGTDTMINLLVPLPPLKEQDRIVTKIEELMPFVDQYATASEALDKLNSEFPDQVKKSILQLAVEGKLVEQRPEEGTGEELFRKIQEEKEKLVKEGKIKKQKPLPEITDEEKPFDIPDSWKWVRLGTLSKAIVDCPHSTPHYLNTEGGYSAIDTNCIDAEGTITHLRYVSETDYKNRILRLEPEVNDIVYTREGSICRAAILPKDKICLGQRVMLIRCPRSVSSIFLQKVLMSPYTVSTLTSKQKGIGAKHVNVSDVIMLPIPLPPYAEQKRIAEKIVCCLSKISILSITIDR